MDIEDIAKISNPTIDLNNSKIIDITLELFSDSNLKLINSRSDITKLIESIGRKHKYIPSSIKILHSYRNLVSQGKIIYNPFMEQLLRTKNVRSLSGVVVITVFTSPYPITSSGIQKFSCEYDCAYCPQEPNQPRSYLLNEPGVLRANANNFIATDQFWDRSKSYILMGHPLDKIELIVSGGTFTSYPTEYKIEFFRDLFYAANVVYDRLINSNELRQKYDLETEQKINETTAKVKIIGITIETRPDQISKKELIFYRFLGITRVQIGVQHLDDRVLKKINRKCSSSHTRRAIKALKEAGFKVDIHLMPDLPAPDNTSIKEMIELDKKMFYDVINLPEYQVDQWKIYPCETVNWTLIKEWYDNGLYKPYGNLIIDGESPLVELLIWVKSNVKPWIRLNRIIRDIPNSYIIAGNQNTSMRSDLLQIMKNRNLICNCIRCREVGSKSININDFKINIISYPANDGKEYFISWINDTNILLGFCRLRINSTFINPYFEELNGCSLLRELHIYGQVIQHETINKGYGVQHCGLGKGLIEQAIKITKQHNLKKIAVIAGIGVRSYYIKQGFESNNYKGNYLIMNIKIETFYEKLFMNIILILLLCLLLIISIFFIIYYL
jgi:ELP3 family radical SAM enzyme/protein acetyltransferase